MQLKTMSIAEPQVDSVVLFERRQILHIGHLMEVVSVMVVISM